MIYGFSLLFVLLCLVTGIPALRRLFYMRGVNRNSATTTGEVISSKSALGWLWTSAFGSVSRPLIRYHTPDGKELVLEVVSSSMFTFQRYETGASEEIVYDSDRPGKAYARGEWDSVVRDLWIAAGGLGLAIALCVLGRVLDLPF